MFVKQNALEGNLERNRIGALQEFRKYMAYIPDVPSWESVLRPIYYLKPG
jgi:hypothetical protein